MDVKTVEDTSFSVRTVATYAAVTCLLVALLLLPTVVTSEYPRVLNTLVLLALLGLVVRTLVSSLLAFTHVDPPERSLPDAELPLVSVLIPAYNEEPVLPDTIEACKALDYPAEKLEVVLCYEPDSTDRTGEICRRAAAEHERFVAIAHDEPDRGKATALNFALEHVRGDVIACIDADHRFKPDAVRRAVAWFSSDEDIWCVTGRCYGDNPTDSLIALHATVERHIAEKADLFARQVTDSFTIFGGGQAFFRPETFEEFDGFDEEVLVEDIDLSSKIHLVGKKLQFDPGIITFEENPATLSAWWNQRKRWARGWMQMAVRYLPLLPRNPLVSVSTKVDAVYTFSYAIIPAFLVVSLPLGWMGLDPHFTTTSYFPNDRLLWTSLSVAPPIVFFVIYLQDRRDGLSHHPLEFFAAFTLWVYLALQSVVFVTAFLEEFVFEKPSVFVTTSRSEVPADD